jgi:hypothetical protein
VLKTSKSFKTKNDNLKLILQRVTLAFDELKFSGVSFTIHELVAKIKGYETKPSLLIDFLDDLATSSISLATISLIKLFRSKTGAQSNFDF